MNRAELLQTAKPLICNLAVAKSFKDERKTQTRRIVGLKNKTLTFSNMQGFDNPCGLFDNKDTDEEYIFECIKPRYKIGDTLWVREPARVTSEIGNRMKFTYLCDEKKSEMEIPNRFMSGGDAIYEGKAKWIYTHKGVPNGCIKEMARMFYKVIDFKYEKLQDISIDDIIAEGFVPEYRTQGEDRDSGYEWWKDLWNTTAPKGKKWRDSPLVEVYTLEKINA